jgi:hypothetical protein
MSKAARVTKRILDVLLLALLLATGLLGIINALDDFRYVSGLRQWTVMLLVMIYGAAGLLAVSALLLKRKWAMAAVIVWAAASTTTALLAPIFYGGTGILTGIASGCAAMLITVPVVLYTRVRLRHFLQSHL